MTAKAPYTFPHRSRAARVAYLVSVGGYRASRQSYPLEFTVGTYYADLTLEHLMPLALAALDDPGPVSDCLTVNERCALLAASVTEAYTDSSSYLYEWALDDVRSALHDADTYRMLYDGSEVLDIGLELLGRGGKHLCITRFPGVGDLRGLDSEALGELLLEQTRWDGSDVEHAPVLRKGYEWRVSSKDVEALYRYVRQCEVDFTSKKASAELEYLATHALASAASIVYQRVLSERANATTVQQAAEAVHACLTAHSLPLDQFRIVCTAAGVTLPEPTNPL